jgi:hypothetical protein
MNMSDQLKNKIEHLLDEPGDTPPEAADALRARLAATFAEGLESAAVSSAGSETFDIAAIAALVDDKLTGAERANLLARLAGEPAARAELESTGELIQSIGECPQEVPKHLLARAQAQFAPPPPAAAAERRWSWTLSLAALFPRQRIAIAALAALAIVLGVPAGLVVLKRGGSGGAEPELTSVSEPEPTPQSCKDKKQDKKDSIETSKDGKKPASSVAKDKDPCDPSGSNAKK